MYYICLYMVLDEVLGEEIELTYNIPDPRVLVVYCV